MHYIINFKKYLFSYLDANYENSRVYLPSLKEFRLSITTHNKQAKVEDYNTPNKKQLITR